MQDTETVNELLTTAEEAVTRALADAWHEVWQRDDAAQLMEGFLGGQISFLIDRDGITILAEGELGD